MRDWQSKRVRLDNVRELFTTYEMVQCAGSGINLGRDGEDDVWQGHRKGERCWNLRNSLGEADIEGRYKHLAIGSC